MKRTIALSFSWLACIFLLAHLFIPHHHHDDSNGICVLVYSDSPCGAHDSDDEHGHDCSDCTAHHKDVSGDCIIKNVYIRADEGKASLSASFEKTDFTNCTAILNVGLQSVYICSETSLRHIPPLILKNPLLLARSCGLRAPPVC